MLWFISYRFVIRKANDTLRELNYPVGSLDDYASAEKKMMLFIVSPAIAFNYLLGELKCAILSIYVCLPHFGKKNNYTKEDILKMVDKYNKGNK